MDKLQIIIVDDHEIVRDGLRALLLGNVQIRVMAEAGNAQELFTLLKTHKPDVIILDIALPGMSGIDIARVLSRDFPDISILMLSGNTQENYIVASVKAGALGFLPKNCSKDELITGIRAVARKQLFFGKNVTESVFQNFVQRIKQKSVVEAQTLSDREMQVLHGFAEGLSYKEIAEQLNISKRTVESHKKTIFEKLQFRNNVDLIKYAIKQGIIFLE